MMGSLVNTPNFHITALKISYIGIYMDMITGYKPYIHGYIRNLNNTFGIHDTVFGEGHIFY